MYHTVLWEPLIREDCEWFQGSNFGFSNRVLQVLLLHDLLPRLSGPHLEGFYCLSIGLHLLSAVLIYLLFVALARWPRSGFPDCSLTRHLGGAMASLLFLVYNSVPISFLSALSYQLVTCFTLLTLLLAQAFLKSRRPLLWLMVLANFSGLFGRGLARLDGAASLKLHEEPLRFALYLQITTMDLVQNLAPLGEKVRRYGLNHDGQPPGDHLILILAGVALASLLAFPRILRRRPPGAAGVFLLFVLLWNLSAYALTRPAPSWDSHLWRFNFNAAGLCLFAPYALLCAADGYAARLGSRWCASPALLLALLAMIMWGPDLGLRSLALWDQAVSGRRGQNPGSCRLTAPCRAWAEVAEADLARPARGAWSLACADLSNIQLEDLDLRGADLRGANLSNTSLRRVNLSGARLDGACFNWARLEDVNAHGARLRGASLVGATLRRVDLTGADTLNVNKHCHRAAEVKGTPPGWRGQPGGDDRGR